MWNSLPTAARPANNIGNFKMAVKIISFHYAQTCMVGDSDKK